MQRYKKKNIYARKTVFIFTKYILQQDLRKHTSHPLDFTHTVQQTPTQHAYPHQHAPTQTNTSQHAPTQTNINQHKPTGVTGVTGVTGPTETEA